MIRSLVTTFAAVCVLVGAANVSAQSVTRRGNRVEIVGTSSGNIVTVKTDGSFLSVRINGVPLRRFPQSAIMLVTANLGAGADNFDATGCSIACRVLGGTGDDTILGGSGPDNLMGGDDFDFIDGGSGNDRIHGGLGRDIVSGGEDSDSVSGDEDEDLVIGGFFDSSDYARVKRVWFGNQSFSTRVTILSDPQPFVFQDFDLDRLIGDAGEISQDLFIVDDDESLSDFIVEFDFSYSSIFPTL